MTAHNFFQKGKISVLISGQWGSEGKGKVAGWLAEEGIDLVVGNNTINSGHIYKKGNFSVKFRIFPTASISARHVFLGPGSSLTLPLFEEEYTLLKSINPSVVVHIHPNVMVITEEEIKWEQENLASIASTMTGNGAILSKKVLRKAKLAQDYTFLEEWVDTNYYDNLVQGIVNGSKCLLESSQGFDLSIDHGYKYPYTTARNIDVHSLAGLSGIPTFMIGKVMVLIRTFPIRVGDGSNTSRDGVSGVSLEHSSSGPFYPDQQEITWEEVTELSGSPDKIFEKTTTTNRPRRVFNFSIQQWRRATQILQPTHLFVNYVNYLDHTIVDYPWKGISMTELRFRFPKVCHFVEDILASQYWEGENAIQEVYLGTGADSTDYLHLF